METRDWTDRAFDPSTGPILVQVDTVEHLFNPIDPQPLNLRDLDVEIADWITNWAEEQHDEKSLTIEIGVADDSATGREEHVAAGIHNHFAYRRWAAGRRLSRLWREGRISLVIGLVVLASFTLLSELLDGPDNGAFLRVVRQGLTVAPWVAMWHPIEALLYDWWPIREQRLYFDKISNLNVEVMLTKG